MAFSSGSSKKSDTPDDAVRRVVFLDTDAEWNDDTAQNLQDVVYDYNYKSEVILLVRQGHSQSQKTSLESEHTADWFEMNTTYTITIADDASIADAVRGYLDEHPKLRFYIVISPCDLEKHFRGHTVYTGNPEGLTENSALTAKRMLQYGMWWENDYENRDPCKVAAQQDLIEDHFQKVIFLDIDGVLNIVDYPSPPEVIVESFVRNLGLIIENTGAEVVLTSSWRYGLYSYAHGGFKGNYKDIDILFSYLDKYKIKIAGITPLYFNGAYGRPFEIRSWLCPRHEVRRFVILDDETFWSWNWLEPHLICTEGEKRGTGRGLSEEDAHKAIELLNSPLKYDRTEPKKRK